MIVVIGNGPSVLKNKFGSIIDTADQVYRINHYKPSKEYVGEKITHYFCNTYKTVFYKDVPEKAKEIIMFDESKFKKCVYEQYNQASYLDIHSVIPHLRNLGFNTSPSGSNRASTGIWLLTYLIYIKNLRNICIYGFDNLISGQQEHYFDNFICNAGNAHNSLLEKRFIDFHLANGSLQKLEDYVIRSKT